MILVDTTGQAYDCSTSIGIPIRSAQAGECRNDIAAVGIVYSGCEVLGIRRLIDNFQLVAQPLDSSAGYEYRTLQPVP